MIQASLLPLDPELVSGQELFYRMAQTSLDTSGEKGIQEVYLSDSVPRPLWDVQLWNRRVREKMRESQGLRKEASLRKDEKVP